MTYRKPFLVLALITVLPVIQPTISSPTKNHGSLKIIDGIEAPLHGIPYQAFIASSNSPNCGGVLISSQWILTAASCVTSGVTATIYLGFHNRKEPDEDTLTLISSREVLHEQYNPKTGENDIALVKLAEIVNETDAIKTIALPKDTKDYKGETGQVSGWGGYVYPNVYILSLVLLYSDDIIISNDECQSTWSNWSIKPSMICLGAYTKRTACFGDVGGPLVVQDDGEPVLAGIVSSLVEKVDCVKEAPSVFTRISSYLEWINKITNN